MDTKYYSEKTIEDFLDDKLFRGDATLKRYYANNEITKFRKRVERVYGEIDKSVRYSVVTDAVRDILIEMVKDVANFVKPYGDLGISGGEAFNIYLPREDRIVTSDIDTKFIPILNADESKYFGYLQCVKLLLWNYVGYICKRYENKIKNRLDTFKNTKLFRFLNIRVRSEEPYLTRRYTLIPKKKQKNKNAAVPEDVLIDVELFAVDLQLTSGPLGGLLDMAIMRPGEFGSDVSFVEKGSVPVASKRFLIEDVLTLQKLGLRPGKLEKDKKRVAVFSEKVLGLAPTGSILNKIPRTPNRQRKPRISLETVISRAMRVNPYKYVERTSVPSLSKVRKLFSTEGVVGPPNLKLKDFSRTSGKYRFDVNTNQWIINDNPEYVRNKYNYRPNNGGEKLNRLPRSYNPLRDNWLPMEILTKAAVIPYVGLKDSRLMI